LLHVAKIQHVSNNVRSTRYTNAICVYIYVAIIICSYAVIS
jgi:hypothetical protein